MIFSSAARIAIAAMIAIALPSVGTAPKRFAPEFNCFASLPAPHPSGGLIKAHMRISCKRQVASAQVEVQLWRLRSWGWEEIGNPGLYKKSRPVRTVDTFASAAVTGADCYYYRSTGRGYVITWKGERIEAPGEGVNFDQRYVKRLSPGCGTKW